MALKVSKDGDNLNETKDYEVVDLNDQPQEEIQVETFEDVVTHHDESVEFNTTAQKKKVSFFEKIRRIFDQEDKTLKELGQQADKIIALEPKMHALSDEDLVAKTDEFKERLAKGETLDDLLVEAYGVVREASLRKLGLHAFRQQQVQVLLQLK